MEHKLHKSKSKIRLKKRYIMSLLDDITVIYVGIFRFLLVFYLKPPGSTASTRPVHCSVSAWTSWSACSEGCGSGVRSRQRHEVLAPNSLGRCPTGCIWIRSGVGGVL